VAERVALHRLALIVTLAAVAAHGDARAGGESAPALAVHITSPLGRTGLAGPIRIVTQVQHPPKVRLQPVKIYVDQKLIGEANDGPPYAIEWTDENPFEPREIVAEACDEAGACARDVVRLEPLTVTEESGVSGVLLEATVKDRAGRYVGGLAAGDFRLTEDDMPQQIDLVSADQVESTYTLLIDCSQSMWRRMDFVQQAADRLVRHLRPNDRVIVAPFTKALGTITGPTVDRATVTNAIATTHAGGGTALIDALTELPRLLQGATGRQTVVLITDGYDENSVHSVEEAERGLKAAQATLFVVGVGGVAGISIKGERVLRELADQSGGRAFFPSREAELPRVHDWIVSDVQQRYLIGYTPSNQEIDGAWRRLRLSTITEGLSVHTRPGYFAPKPPPVRATIEFVAANALREPVQMSADDLEIVEDGVPQTIDTFQEAVAPLSIVLALDASGSMKSAAEAVKDAAKSFLQSLRPSDDLALLIFSDTAVMVHDLTKNRQWTIDGIDQYHAAGGTALNDALVLAIARVKASDNRRAIVVLTDGRDENNPGTAPGSRHMLADVLDNVRDVDAAMYMIGLGSKVDRGVLETVARVSGGEAFFPQAVTELGGEYRRVIDHLRQRYIVSYVSTNPTRNGEWRTVEIIPKKDAKLTISSRGGYVAPRHK
jgi:VWFA-related protein